jgi:hypothetical protein
VEWVGESAILYSLGNLVFGVHREHVWTGRGFVYRIVFSRDGAPRLSACPFVTDDDMPRRPTDDEWAKLEKYFVGYLEQTSAPFGSARVGSVDGERCLSVVRAAH